MCILLSEDKCYVFGNKDCDAIHASLEVSATELSVN